MPGAAISVGVNLFGRDMLSGPINTASMRMRGFVSVTGDAERQMRVATMVGAGFAGMLGVRLVGSMKNAIGTASRLEDIMISVKRIGGFTTEQIQKMSRSFLILSAQLPLSAEELARVGVIAARLGVKGTAALEKLAFTSAQLARSTVLTEETAASALARISRLFGLDVVKASNAVSSAMVAMATSSTATADEIADITVRMGGMAKVMGVSAAQAMALAATMRDAGLRVEMSGSAIMRILSNMTSRQEAFAQMLGMTTENYKQLFRVDPMAAFTRLLHVVSKMDKMDVSAQLKKLGLSNVRTSMTILGLSRQLGTLQRNMANASQAFQSATKVSEMYEMATKSLNAKISTFVGSVKNVFIIVGNYLLPIFKFLVQLGINLLSVFLKLPKAVHILTAALFGIAGVFGIFLAQFAALQMMMLLFAGPALATGATVGVLATMFRFYSKAVKSVIGPMKSAISEMGALVKKGAKWAKNLVVTNALALKSALRQWGLAGAYKYLNYKMGDAIRRGWAWIVNLWTQAKAAAVATINFIKLGATATWSFLRVAGGAMKAATGIAAFGASFGPLLVVLAAMAVAITAIVVITQVLVPLFSEVAGLLTAILVPAFRIVWAAVGAVVNIFRSLAFGMKVLISIAIIPLVIAVKALGVIFRVLEFVIVPVLNAIAWMVRVVGVVVGPLAIMYGLIWAVSNATRVWAAATWLWNAATGFAVKLLGIERKQMLLNYWLKLKNLWVTIKTEAALYREAAAIWFESLRRGKGLIGLIKENALRAWNWITMKKQVLWTKIKTKWDWLSNKLAKKGITWAKIRHALAWKNIRATIADTRAKIANWLATKKGIMGGGRLKQVLFGTSTAAAGAAGSTGILASAAAALGVSVGVLLGVVAAAIAAIAIFVVVAVKWYKALKNASAATKFLMIALIPLIGAISPLIGVAAIFATALWAIKTAIGFVVRSIAMLIGQDFMGVVTIWKQIKEVISGILKPIQELFDIFKGVGKETNLLKTIFTPLFIGFRAMLQVWLTIAHVIKAVVEVIAGALKPIFLEIKQFVDFVLDAFKPITKNMDEAAKKGEMFAGVFRALTGVVKFALWPIRLALWAIGNALTFIFAWAKVVIPFLISHFKSLWTSVKIAIAPIGEIFMEIGGMIWDSIKPVIDIFKMIIGLFGSTEKSGKKTGSFFRTLGTIIGKIVTVPFRILAVQIRVAAWGLWLLSRPLVWSLKAFRIFGKVIRWLAGGAFKVLIWSVVTTAKAFWWLIKAIFKINVFFLKLLIAPFYILYKVIRWVIGKAIDPLVSVFKVLWRVVSVILKMIAIPFVILGKVIWWLIKDAIQRVIFVFKILGAIAWIALQPIILAFKALWSMIKIGVNIVKARIGFIVGALKAIWTALTWIVRTAIAPFIAAFKIAKAVVVGAINTIIQPFLWLESIINAIWDALFGSSLFHLVESIAKVMGPLLGLVKLFSRLLKVVELVSKVIGAVWGAIKTGVKIATAPLRAVGWVAKKSFGLVASAAKAGWSVAASVGAKAIGSISKGLKKIGGAAKKVWGSIFGSSIFRIAEGIWFVLPWIRRLMDSFSLLFRTTQMIRMEPAFAGIPAATATIRHEVSREAMPVRIVTAPSIPATVPPPLREVLEIRAKIPFIIMLDGTEIARGIKEVDEFDMIREYREPDRSYRGICK